MQLDPNYVAFVKHEEGFSSDAKWDFKQWTNGYGTRALHPHEHISVEVADQRLEAELGAAQELVLKHFGNDLPQGILNALTDLTYNSGFEWAHDKLGEAIKARNWGMAKAHFLMYDKAGGRVLKDLELRRAKAAEWFPAAEPKVETVAAVPTLQPAQAPRQEGLLQRMKDWL